MKLTLTWKYRKVRNKKKLGLCTEYKKNNSTKQDNCLLSIQNNVIFFENKIDWTKLMCFLPEYRPVICFKLCSYKIDIKYFQFK